MGVMQTFFAVLGVMMFYSFAITTVSYAMPEGQREFVTAFSGVSASYSLETISSDVQQSIQKQTNIPIIDLGALIFYSSNFIVDLLMNFLFALPQMLTLVVTGFLMLFNVDTGIANLLQLYLSAVMVVTYILSIITMLLGARSRGGIV